MVSVNKSQPDERLAIVRWAAQMGAITARALAVREQVSVASARGRLYAAVREGLLVAQRPLTAQPVLFSATRAGIALTGLHGLQPARVREANARHTIVCASVAAALERIYLDHDVVGERELRREEHDGRTARASAVLGKTPEGIQLLHRPDLVIWPHTSGAMPVAVEVELTIKAPQRLLSICRAWARSSCVDGVIYVAPPEVRRALQRAIAGAQAGDRVVVVAPSALGLAESSEPTPENHPK